MHAAGVDAPIVAWDDMTVSWRRFDAAVLRCEYALKSLKNSGLEPEGMVLLGEIYMKQKRKKDAREVLTRLLTQYPESAFAVPAKNFLAQLDKT